jgi:CHAT domain-containing protein/tetratricopeptide (TPR) repeat protein
MRAAFRALGGAAILASALAFADERAASSGSDRTGLVVEGVGRDSGAARAGLQEGDLVVSWSRGPSAGGTACPFVLGTLEMEEAPRGPVTFAGFRATEKREWTVPETRWSLRARPEMPEALLALYRDGRALQAADKAEEAALRFRQGAESLSESGSSCLGAWLLLQAAEALVDAGASTADQAFELAAERARRESTASEVIVLRTWTVRLLGQSEWAKAKVVARRAAETSRRLSPESLTLAVMLHGQGFVAQRAQDPAEAEDYLARAQALKEKLAPGSVTVAVTLNTRGVAAGDRGDLERAEEYLSRSREIAGRRAPGGIELAQVLNNLANLADDRGDLGKARLYYLEALDLDRKLFGEGTAVADVLDNLALNALYRGDLAQAETYSREAMALYGKGDASPDDYARALNNSGLIASAAGDWARAETLFGEALARKEKLGPDAPLLATTLEGLGDVAWSRDDIAGADEKYRRALEIREKALGPDHLALSDSLQALASVAQRRRDPAAARVYLTRALAIKERLSPAHPDVASCLVALGDLARAGDDWATAEKHYQRALEIREKAVPDSTDHAEALAAVGLVLRHKGEADKASEYIARAVDVLESQTARLGGAEERRFAFRARHAEYYTAYIDLLLERNEPTRAFQVLERSRGRLLLEALEEARLDIRTGVDPSLIERESAVRALLAAKSDRLLRPPLTRPSRETLEKEVGELLAELRDVKGQVRARQPAAASPRALPVESIQRDLLDADTLLLEYELGDARSRLWALTRESLSVHELPGRKVIEDAAWQMRSLAAAAHDVVEGESAAARRARRDKAAAEYPRAAAQLGRVLLGPVADRLGRRTLAIVPDGALHYVPFAGLVAEKDPLLVGHEIVYLPSASVLAVQRQEAAKRPARSMEVAVLADPVFDEHDKRVTATLRVVASGPDAAARGATEAATALTRAIADFGTDADGGLRLRRLPGTRDEANAIMAVVPPGKGMLALDYQASRTTATSPDLAGFRVVHFATHGLLNTRHPELSGVVLSMVDERGQPQNGYLALADIYNMSLPVDLVVLSGCQTALGTEIRGEGVIGLSRGFQYAGASRVVTSLWKVDDLATAELMRRFYGAMEKGELRPSAALRRAQLEMRSDPDWGAPYYWAAFQMHGEWR